MTPDQELERFIMSRGADYYLDYATMNYRIRYKGHNFAINRMSVLHDYPNSYGMYIANLIDQFNVIDEAEYRNRFTIDVTDLTSYYPAPPDPVPTAPKKNPSKPVRDFTVKKTFNFDIDDCEI